MEGVQAVAAASSSAAEPSAKRPRLAADFPSRGPRFGGKVVVITGAAGNFGSTCAHMLAKEGGTPVLADLAEKELLALAAEIRSSYGVTAKVFAIDVTKEDQVQKMVEETKKEFGHIDGLFNNAGYQGLFAPVDRYSVDDFDKVMRINVTGVFVLLKHVSKVMIEQERGAIVNTASCAGLGTPSCMPAYASSKAAVCHLTKIAANDLAPKGVRVNSVSPAFIGPEDGFMWKRQVQMQADANPTGAPEFFYSNDPKRVAEQMLSSVPLRRLGTPVEVIQAVLFLLSDESSYITGTDMNISGGNVMGGSRG